MDNQETVVVPEGTTEQPKTQETTKPKYTPEQTEAYIKTLREEAKNARLEVDSWKTKYTEKETETTTLKTENENLKISQKTLTLENALTGKVVDVKKALKLIDETHYDDKGVFKVEDFLKENSFLQLNQTKKIDNTEDDEVTPETKLEGKSEAWLVKNWNKVVNQK